MDTKTSMATDTGLAGFVACWRELANSPEGAIPALFKGVWPSAVRRALSEAVLTVVRDKVRAASPMRVALLFRRALNFAHCMHTVLQVSWLLYFVWSLLRFRKKNARAAS